MTILGVLAALIMWIVLVRVGVGGIFSTLLVLGYVGFGNLLAWVLPVVHLPEWAPWAFPGVMLVMIGVVVWGYIDRPH
jgi:hypothetical protein